MIHQTDVDLENDVSLLDKWAQEDVMENKVLQDQRRKSIAASD